MLDVTAFGGSYAGRSVMITGHTGFKGSWLSLWLDLLGARVSGLALDPPSEPNHWSMVKPPVADHRADIRDHGAVQRILLAEKPEIVFHLAAQPLVRQSYQDPITTWSTNVMGTAHLLEAVRAVPDVRAVVVVTSDKCYENREWPWPYRERDRLGGHDPYSASKAAAELVAASYRNSYPMESGSPLIATARGGNVIGGGDWSTDRLIPDLVRAVGSGRPLVIRSPQATRPWQHVLDCLSGYLLVGQRLLDGSPACAGAWNFGPDTNGIRTVQQVLGDFQRFWPQLRWEVDARPQPHEAALLALDSTQAREQLKWRPVWGVEDAVRHTADWYRDWSNGKDVPSVDQLARYQRDARDAGLTWTA